jgi:hypothetical protein
MTFRSEVPLDQVTYEVAMTKAIAARIAGKSRSFYYWCAAAGLLEQKLRASGLWKYVGDLG